MPRNRPSPEPPVMTWGKVSLVLTIAAVSDILRYACLFLWFLGPFLVSMYCMNKVGGVAVIGGLLASGCAAGAVAIGVSGYPLAIAIGSVMAIVTGFAGWLMVTLIILAKDERALMENPRAMLWLFAGIGASVLAMTWGIYHKQVQIEKAAHKKWEKENADRLQQEQNQQVARLMQAQQQEAANDAEYNRQSAANDEQYDPTEVAENETFRQTQKERAQLDTSSPPGIPALTAANDAQYTQKKAA